ncbi:SDR family oxidoreductase [Aeromicrobium sp.]|uniref:SDR family oxidoreductase n=1 Tax=Aeromicrobium sp. TaxID=1871063 RepID=UPI003C471B22
MSQIAIVGGNGKIARHLIPQLVASGHQPVALVRNPTYKHDLEQLGAQVRMLDIEQDGVEHYAASFAECDAVVFTAGGGPDGNIERKRTVDLGGSLSSIEAAQQAGIDRFVQISAINVDQPVGDDAEPVWKAYVEAKRDADIALRESGLDWTILRPGRLTDDDGTGRVTLGEKVDPISDQQREIPRADVAAVVVAALDNPSSIGRQWDVVGGQTPVDEAVASA